MVATVARIWGWLPWSRGRQDLRAKKSLVINASLYIDKLFLHCRMSATIAVSENVEVPRKHYNEVANRFKDPTPLYLLETGKQALAVDVDVSQDHF